MNTYRNRLTRIKNKLKGQPPTPADWQQVIQAGREADEYIARLEETNKILVQILAEKK